MYDIIFLHGFFSSSKSHKIQFFKSSIIPELAKHNQVGDIIAPDLYPNKEDFETMTITHLVKKVVSIVHTCNNPVILVGSSHGGIIAASVAYRIPEKISGLVLLAPALNFLKSLKSRFVEDWNTWKSRKFLEIQQTLWEGTAKWSWNYIEDLRLYQNWSKPFNMPILIIHGENDETIPVEDTIKFIKTQESSNVNIEGKIIENGVHNLGNVLPNIKKAFLEWFHKYLLE